MQIYLEPGEAVVLNAGYLVSTVLETMKNLAPFSRFLLAGKERAAAGREVRL